MTLNNRATVPCFIKLVSKLVKRIDGQMNINSEADVRQTIFKIGDVNKCMDIITELTQQHKLTFQPMQ